MTTQFCKGDIEQMKPKLIEGATVTKFAPDIHFVQHEGRFVKIDDAEFELISDFNGELTLADIITARLSKGDTAIFDRLLMLINRLSKADLFNKECASVFKYGAKKRSGVFEHYKKIALIPANSFCSKFGSFSVSIPGLVILFFLAVPSVLQPHLRGANLLKELTGAVLSDGYAYLAAIFFIGVSMFAVQSLAAFLNGSALASKGVSVPLYFRCKLGLVSFWTNSIPVVSVGKDAAIRHYLMKLILPFSIAGVASILWQLDFYRPAMAILHVITVATGLWAASPLLKSPFTMLTNFFIKGEGKTSTFLRRRFIKDIFNFKQNSAETDRLIIQSVLGLLWLYAIYLYFWYVANSTVSHLLADTISASGATLVLVGISLAFIVIPILLLALGALLVLIGNIGGVVKNPFAKMRRLADSITSKKVPPKAQVAAFLQLIPLFSGLDEVELLAICSHIRLHRFSGGRKIIQQGDSGDCFYTIVSGEVDVVYEDASGRERVVETLSTGDSFGEIALIEKVPRTASIVAKVPTAVFEINRESFEKFIVSSVGGKEKITEVIRLGKLLMSNPLFSFMSPKQISSVIMKFGYESCIAGATVFSQGDKGDKFYLIKEGTVHVKRVEESRVVIDKTLEQGQFFGEIALIREIPRTASVKAISDCSFATLTKEQFIEVIGHSIFSGKQLDAVMHERALQLGKEALKECL